jgi:hypothetical protein
VLEGFQDGDAVGAPAAKVVHLTDARLFGEGLNEARHVVGMDVIPHLLALIAVDFVQPLLDIALDQVAQKAVQLDATMVRAGQTAAAQATRLQAEVAPVLLHHDISGDFGDAEQAVRALVDGELFRDAVGEGRIGIVPARRQLRKRDGVGAVALDLVGAHVHEYGIWGMAAGRFQEVQGADGVDLEIVEGPCGGQVVTGLRGGMHDQGGTQTAHQGVDPGAIANIQMVMAEIRLGGQPPPRRTARIAF